MSIEKKTFEIEARGVDSTIRDLQRLEHNLRAVSTAIYGAIGLLRRMGFGENVDAALLKIQQLISMANMLRLSLISLQAASGPLGWVMAGVGVMGSLATVGGFIEDLGWDLHRHQM